MKNSTLRRIVALTVAVCLLVGLSPLLKSITGFADANAAFVARISGGPQQSGATFSEAFAKANTKNVTSIAMIAGELSEADITSLVAQGLHTGLNSITMVTPPPSISSADVFKGFPDNRILAVPAADISSYRIVDDGIVDDNFWFGWNLMEATPEAINVVKEIQEIANPASVMIDAPAVGGTPQFDLAVGTGYTSTITWKNGAELHNGAFAENTVYTADVVLTSVEGFKFAANASASVPTGTITSYAVAGGDISSNTLSFTVTFANTTPGANAPAPTPPVDDGTLPPVDDGALPPVDDGALPPVDDGALPPINNGTLPPIDNGTSSGTSSEATSSEEEEWKPTEMGGFANAPVTKDIPVPYANEVLAVTIKPTMSNSPQSTSDVEIGGIVTLLGEITNPELPPVNPPNVIVDVDHPTDPTANPDKGKKITAVEYTAVNTYVYKWVESPANSTMSGVVADGLSLTPNVFTKAHLGAHKYTLSVTENTEITKKTTVTFDPPDYAPTNNPPIDDVITNATQTANASIDINVVKIPTKVTLECKQISNKTAQMTATVTGMKPGVDWPFRDNTTNPEVNTRFGAVAFNPGEAGEKLQREVTSESATNCVFTLDWNPLSEKVYNTTAKYLGDDNYAPSPSAVKDYTHKLMPKKITTSDIGVITIDPPIAGEKITTSESLKKPANASPGYSLDLKWYLGDSLVTERFYQGRSHKAIVTITSLDNITDENGELQSYTIAENTIATFVALGASIRPTTPIPGYPSIPTIFGGNERGVGNYIQYTITFPSTQTDEQKAQAAFAFNPYAVPTTKTYGDSDFILHAYGGAGNGSVTYTSDKPDVLRVTTDPYGQAVIKVMGAGTAIITATKAESFEGNNNTWYGEAKAVTTPIVVAPRMLTATVDDKTIKVGSRTTAFKVRVRGFVNGDTEDNLSGYAPPVANADIEDIPPLGTYDIKVSGGKADPKYKFKYVHGILTVNETGIPPTTSNTTNTVIANGNSAYIHEPRNDVTLIRKDAQFFETGVEMTVDNQTSTISVVESDIINRNINAAVPGKSMANVYNIALSLDNENYLLNTDVTTQLRVTNAIKSKYTDLGIVRVDAAGNVMSIPSTLTSNGEYITFTTNYVGKFAIVGKLRVASNSTTPPVVPPVTGNPQTGDSTPSFPSATALLGGTIFVAATRKEDEIIC